MSSLTKWVANWFAPSRAPANHDRDRFSITYQWSYEPAEGSRQALSPIPPVVGGPHAETGTVSANTQAAVTASSARTALESKDPPARGVMLPQQVAFVQRLLAAAEERWWSTGQLPSRDVLRSALELRAAGSTLEQSQLPLLLRTSLYYRRGVLTALRYQTDMECTALILAEAIADGRPPLPLDDLVSVLRTDPASPAWRPLLARELQAAYLTHGDDAIRFRIAAALAVLMPASSQLAATTSPVIESNRRPGAARVALGLFGIGLLLAFVVGAIWHLSDRGTADAVAVSIPADTAGSAPTLTLWVDRTEVTNDDYRRCYHSGACPWPADTNAAGIDDYFRNASYSRHPVVHVDQPAAADYCKWQGKRLPTATEWRIAAGLSPLTGRAYRYPWGDTFGITLANSLEAAVGQPQQVGTYHPAGDSRSGISDMAGNVAEWTSTPGDSPDTFAIVGGSYRDPASQLMVEAETETSATATADWLGFRCVRPSR